MRRQSSREKHSFIQFYFDDWKAGTAHMTRSVRSVYFDICLYNWDKRKPASHAALKLMLSDLPDGREIVEALVEEGTLEVDINGSVHSPRAMREAERAFEAWEQKSRAGKKARKSIGDETPMHQRSIGDGEKAHECSTDTDTDSDSDSEPDSEERGEDSSSGDADVSGLAPDEVPFVPIEAVPDAWNEMAKTCGLPQIKLMTEERLKRLRARIGEHGSAAIIEGIKMIPDRPFLLGKGPRGWKCSFDWLLQPASCTRLVEGGYEEGEGRPNGWTQD